MPARLKVLVAEDSRVSQIVARRLLEKLGHLPVLACNGAEALEKLRSETFDLVLMDCQMPELDGYDVTRALRSGGPPLDATLPVIALTASDSEEDRERCLDAGMDHYLVKPLTLESLTRAIRETLGEVPGPEGQQASSGGSPAGRGVQPG